MSQKEKIALWFEFYKLALENPSLASECLKSTTFYERWMDIRHQRFENRWWKEHLNLFGEPYVQEISNITEPDAAIYLAIPFDQSITKSLSQIRQILTGRTLNRGTNAYYIHRAEKLMLAAARGDFPGHDYLAY